VVGDVVTIGATIAAVVESGIVVAAIGVGVTEEQAESSASSTSGNSKLFFIVKPFQASKPLLILQFLS
jgi:hypothetical protein